MSYINKYIVVIVWLTNEKSHFDIEFVVNNM